MCSFVGASHRFGMYIDSTLDVYRSVTDYVCQYSFCKYADKSDISEEECSNDRVDYDFLGSDGFRSMTL